MKKTLLLLAALVVGIGGVKAEAYYTNENGLEFTEYQYNVMTDIMGEENVSKLTVSQYNTYAIGNMTEENHTYVSTEDTTSSLARGTSHETASKKLSISAVCYTNFCNVTTYNKWKVNPSVRSHDVIGVRLSGISFYDTSISAHLVSEETVINASGSKGMSNGAGSIIKLPSTDLDYATQTVRVTRGGTIYGSYQHAVKTVSYATAYTFSVSSLGLGGVFVWDSSYGTLYDGMGGVSVSL